jgi:arsenate reductase (thioredoxin)
MKTVLLFAFATILTQTIVAQEKKIIFVCEHGAAKSVIAASYFNKMAKERNLDYVAECRGTSPDSVVSPGIKDNLTREKVFDPNIKPRKLLIKDTANVERIILFTTLPPDLKTDIKTENWSTIQNVDADYEKRRNAIVKKINELLDSLEKQ